MSPPINGNLIQNCEARDETTPFLILFLYFKSLSLLSKTEFQCKAAIYLFRDAFVRVQKGVALRIVIFSGKTC